MVAMGAVVVDFLNYAMETGPTVWNVAWVVFGAFITGVALMDYAHGNKRQLLPLIAMALITLSFVVDVLDVEDGERRLATVAVFVAIGLLVAHWVKVSRKRRGEPVPTREHH